MKDFLGNELNVGDEVVYIEKVNGGARLALGKICEFKSGSAYMKKRLPDGSYVDWLWCYGCKGSSIMKLNLQSIDEGL